MSDEKPMTWKVERRGLVLPSGNLMTAACIHRKAGACGGCFARFYVLLDELAKSADPKALILQVEQVMKAEFKEKAKR